MRGWIEQSILARTDACHEVGVKRNSALALGREPAVGRVAMFFLATRLVSAVRLFSTSPVAQYPKLKSHSGAKKRWRSMASGVFKRVRRSSLNRSVCPEDLRSPRLARSTLT